MLDIRHFLKNQGLTFKESNMVPLGWDYGCASPKKCTNKFLSLNSIYSYDVSP